MKIQKQTPKTTFIGMLIDDSGSMAGVRKETLSAFNEQLQVIRNSMVGPDHKVLLTTAIFSEPGKFKILRHWADPMSVELLSEKEYTTAGSSTALLDAMAELLDVMEEKKVEAASGQNAALVQFFTDGMNNNSKKILSTDVIKSRIQELSATGHWTFTYMGVGSIDEIASQYGFQASNVAQFATGKAGMHTNSVRNAAALMSYASSRTLGSTYAADLYSSTEEDEKKTTS